MKFGVYVIIVLLVSLYIVVSSFFINAKIIVPAQERYRTLKTEKESVEKELKKLSVDSSVVYKEILKDKEKYECEVLSKYIKTVASNLLPDTVDDVAKALVHCSTRNNIPIALVVGLCETQSKFNPTTLTEYNERGLFKVDIQRCDGIALTDVVKLHDPMVGAIHGTDLLAKIIRENNQDMLKVITEYNKLLNVRDNTEVSDKFEHNVCYNSVKYLIFRTATEFSPKKQDDKHEAPTE